MVAATLTLNNSILATTPSPHNLVSESLVFGTATVGGSHNLVTTFSLTTPPAPGVITLTAEPQLGLLQNNGGLTPTLLPLPGSPGLGVGDPDLAPGFDQRGVRRPAGGPTDLGSVQVSGVPSPPPGPSPSPPPSPSPGPPPDPPAPSLLSAIIGLYIAEAEKAIGFGDPTALQNTIDFDSQYTIFAGINLATFIEMIADANVRAARGDS